MEELKLRLENSEKKPSIIMITEMKPKNCRYTLSEAEINLDQYNLVTKNIDTAEGRAIAN